MGQLPYTTLKAKSQMQPEAPPTHLVIGKCDEGKCSEGFRNEDVGDLAVLHEELPELVSGHVFCTAADKDLTAAHGLVRTGLGGDDTT